jgi:ATP-dependent Clp protease adaptor protein ClpS
MQEKKSPLQNGQTRQRKLYKLVLYNDDFNTFEHVIESLMFYCEFSVEQAEQCAWITHYKGKCILQEGEYEEIKDKASGLSEEGLTVEVY